MQFSRGNGDAQRCSLPCCAPDRARTTEPWCRLSCADGRGLRSDPPSGIRRHEFRRADQIVVKWEKKKPPAEYLAKRGNSPSAGGAIRNPKSACRAGYRDASKSKKVYKSKWGCAHCKVFLCQACFDDGSWNHAACKAAVAPLWSFNFFLFFVYMCNNMTM